MKFVNTSGNTVYIEDIDLHIPYSESQETHEIESDMIKKSKAFQKLVILGAFSIVEANDSRIEQNLIKLQKDHKKKEDELQSIEETRMDSGNGPEIVLKGHFYDAGGYSKVNRNLAIILHKMGVKVEINPTSTRNSDLNEIEASQMNLLKRKVGKNAIKIDSIIPSFSEMSGTLSYRILYTTVESCSIPKQTVDVCNAYNEVWVTSDFCKDVLLKHGVKREIYVIPSSVDVNLYKENIKPHLFRPPLKPFSFISVFGWSYRKGYDALLKAYLQSFTGDDPVSLLIVSRYQYATDSSKFIKQEIDKYIKQYGGNNPPHIARCNKVIPEHCMPNIYKAASAFVLPSRGEGFGMPYCEASMCGLPVISTNYSGQTMFLNKDNSYLVDIDNLIKLKPGMMHVHYWDNQLFPDLTSKEFIDKFAETMKYVYNNYEESINKNKLLQQYIIKEISKEAAGKKAKARIDEIWKQIRK